MMKRLLFGAAVVLALFTVTSAQVAVPNTLVDGATITAGPLNTNFTTIANHALDRLSGGNIGGTITVDPGITIDGVDIGATVCATCAPTFKDLVLASPATGFTVATHVVVTSTGNLAAAFLTGTLPDATFPATIPAASGVNLTGLNATNIGSGTLNAARLPATAVVTNATNTFTARNDFLTYTETKTVITPAASPAIDLSLGSHFTYANSTTPTFSFTNPPASGRAGSFTLAITGNGTSHPPVWPASVKWASGAAPTVTTTNAKVDIFTFLTYDGGTTWYGLVGGQNF